RLSTRGPSAGRLEPPPEEGVSPCAPPLQLALSDMHARSDSGTMSSRGRVMSERTIGVAPIEVKPRSKPLSPGLSISWSTGEDPPRERADLARRERRAIGWRHAIALDVGIAGELVDEVAE